MVAKTGRTDSCPYDEKCRFSHNIEAFKAQVTIPYSFNFCIHDTNWYDERHSKTQKPADLEGNCPFEGDEEGPCPYGLGCRFLGTHKTDAPTGTPNSLKNSEINGLKKDVQRLLWKNKMKFPKADAQLKVLGLMVLVNNTLHII